MYYGVIKPNDQFFFFDLDNNKEPIHDCIVALSKSPGFMDYNSILKLYNTALNLILDADFNKDIIGLFKEIMKGLNLIPYLKVDSNYTNFLEELDSYTNKHKNIMEKWESDEDFSCYNGYIYDKYNFTKMLPEDFQQLSDESTQVDSGVYTLHKSTELEGYISKDIHSKIKGQLYYIPQNKTGNLNKDIALSISCILNQVIKAQSNDTYNKNVMHLGMNIEGLHSEHIVGANLLFGAFRYLLNSESVKNNELYFFDEIEVNRKIEHAKLIISRIPLLVKSRLD